VKQVRRTGRLRRLREGDRALSVVGRGAGDDRHAALGGLRNDLDHAPLLVRRHRRGFAGAAAGDEEVNPLRELPLDERLQCSFVDMTVSCKRCHQRRAASGQARRHVVRG
jgi:hypothetical protein